MFWNCSGLRTNPYVKFSLVLCVCVDDVVRLRVEPWRGCKFFLADGLNKFLKNLLFFVWHYQVEKAVWYKPFANLVYASTPIHLSTWLRDLWFKVVLS